MHPALVAIFMIAWAIMAIKSCSTGEQIPSFPSGLPVPLTVIGNVLGLATKYNSINERERTINLSTNQGEKTFSPDEFIYRHGIDLDNPRSVSDLDSKIVFVVRKCNKEGISNSGGNHLAMLERRASCLYANGYNNNDQAYIYHKFN